MRDSKADARALDYLKFYRFTTPLPKTLPQTMSPALVVILGSVNAT